MSGHERASSRVGGSLRVVCVDGAGLEGAVASLAESDGVEVERAAHASAALDLLETEPVDCIVGEHASKGTDWQALLEAARSRQPDVRVVVLVDDETEQVTNGESKASTIDYISKTAATTDGGSVAEVVRTTGECSEVDAMDGEPTEGLGADREPRDAEHRSVTRSERTDAAFDVLPDPALRVRYADGEPVVRESNGTFEALFGYRPAELAGEPVPIHLRPSEGGPNRDRRSDPVPDGERTPCEIRCETKDGARDFLLRDGRVETPTDSVEEIWWYVDITDRVTRERELERQRDDLTVLNRVLRHDIRNNLQAVLTNAELLTDRLAGDEQEHATSILDTVDSAVELTQIAGELATTITETGDRHEPIALADTLRSQIEVVRSSHDDATFRTPGELPSVTVLADELLGSVFRNVLQNAVQHNDKAIPEVTVSVHETTDEVLVAVADNGPGIPDPVKEVLFDEDQTEIESQGLGIGLYLVETITRSYGGGVRVWDNDPEGTVFEVVLPKAE